MGAIGVSDYDGVTSPAYDILRVKVQINNLLLSVLLGGISCVTK
jgi:type I restriction enzyme, S subunit